jgi:hypothetical protein
MRRPHHHAFKHGLPADQRFFPTLESREKLDSDQKSN